MKQRGKIVVVGGGWAGCAAALQARRMGMDVLLIERTDLLLGTGLVGGIMRNNGRFTAAEELIALGGGTLIDIIDSNYLHRDIEFPNHIHASLYNTVTMEPLVQGLLESWGIEIWKESRVIKAEKVGNFIGGVTVKQRNGKKEIYREGDAFIDATGTAGMPAHCSKYGQGCVQCIMRCRNYGNCLSLLKAAQIKEIFTLEDGVGSSMSGSCSIQRESLAPEVREKLDQDGVLVIPLPKEHQMKSKLALKVCQQYALKGFSQNIVLLNTGSVKMMTPYLPLSVLQQLSGLEEARYSDPALGEIGNSIRHTEVAPRENSLRVQGMENLFCCGEKAGLFVGHTEALCTGTLAGYNAVQKFRGESLLVLPNILAVGDMIQFAQFQMKCSEGLKQRYTFSGSVYFKRMKQRDLYTTKISSIKSRVKKSGLENIFKSS